MPPTPDFLVCTNPVAHALQVPALLQSAQRTDLTIFVPARFKNLGYPPNEWYRRPSRRDRLCTIRAKLVRNLGFGVRSHVVLKGLPVAFLSCIFLHDRQMGSSPSRVRIFAMAALSSRSARSFSFSARSRAAKMPPGASGYAAAQVAPAPGGPGPAAPRTVPDSALQPPGQIRTGFLVRVPPSSRVRPRRNESSVLKLPEGSRQTVRLHWHRAR